MADYSQQNARDYGARHASQQRDAAYSNMYPPRQAQPRSQTMSSQTYQAYSQHERSQTMTGQPPLQRRPQEQSPPPNGYQQQQQQQQQRPQQQQQQQQYPVAQPNYGQRPPPHQHQYQQQQQQQPSQRHPQSPLSSSSQQYGPGPGPGPGSGPVPGDRGPYPPRGASRQGSMGNQQYRPPPPPQLQQQQQQQQYPRSQSMASHPRPQIYPPHQQLQQQPPQQQQSQSGYNMAPAQASRQQQYNHMSRTTTTQGRNIPERSGDERSMSMSSYQRETESGRLIPNRKRESNDTDASSPSTAAPPAPLTIQNRQRSDSQASVATISTAVSTVPSRTFSMASTITPTGTSKPLQAQELALTQRRTPLVYPALLCRVAEAFKDRISVADHQKDGLDYKSAFTGEEAVTIIAYIIKTTDRNLALLLGRSLDAQKLFHDVTYANRLRDQRNELYQFRDPLVEGNNEVNGVFILLTECYSPTCTRDRVCYSIACPRRLEQQARLKLRPQPGLKRADSHTSLHDDAGDEQKLWINIVSKEVSDAVSDKEKKRQEVISELAYTERDFVKDLEYMRDFWIKPLRTSQRSPIPEHRREKFIKSVFSNLSEIYNVNSKLAEALTRRQQDDPVVKNVGDIFLEMVPKFSPFITYGASQLFGKHEFENERKINPAFTKFVEETERLKESRKLELNGYLTKPTTRLARYPLLLEGILKATADGNPDKEDIPKAILMIREFLSKVNTESGKAENHFTMMSLNRELKFRPGEYVDLKLTEGNRQLVFKGMLKRNATDQQGDIKIYLFDHAVLLVRVKVVNGRDDLKVFRKPIPLELLTVAEMADILPNRIGLIKRPSTALSLASNIRAEPKLVSGYPVTLEYLGKEGYKITLHCSTQIQQQKLIEHIDSQQQVLFSRANIYTKSIINQGFFNSVIRVHCAVPFGKLSLVLCFCIITH
jgi:hypothetical protein